MFCDIHCHLIPAVDDGASSLEEALDMLKEGSSSGLASVATTPHFWPGTHDFGTLDDHERAFRPVREASDISLIRGCEVRVNTALLPIMGDRRLTYGQAGKFILLELPTQEVPTYLKEIIFNLRLDGVTPIIAHPERNFGLLSSPEQLLPIIRAGALLQLTASSIEGGLGPTIQAFSRALLELKLVSFVASDAHNTSTRPFSDWNGCLERLREWETDSTYLQEISYSNPKAVIEGVSVATVEIEDESLLLERFQGLRSSDPPKRKRFFFF